MRDWHTAVCCICSCSVVANRLSWTAWDTGIQLCLASVPVQLWQTNCHGMCVASVAVQLWQTDCHGLHERLPYSSVTSVAVHLWQTDCHRLCVASVAVQLRQREWHGLYERLAYSSVCHLYLFSCGRLSWAVWETDIQLCVSSVAFHLWLRDCHGLQGRPPWHVQHSHFNRTQITLWFTRDGKNIPVTLSCSEPVTQPANVQVFSNSRHCCVSARSATVWL